MHLRMDKQILKLILIIIGTAIFLGCAYFILNSIEQKENVYVPDETGNDDGYVYLGGTPYQKRNDITTYLVLGIDNFGKMQSSGSYINDGQSDFIGLIVYNRTDNSYRILQINRDTMTDVDVLGIGGKVVETKAMQVALAHTYGNGMHESCRNTVKAVQNLLYGIEIDHYIAINMTGVEKLVDAVGGVTITINHDFSHVDPTLVQGETMLLNGQQTLTYVRSRSSVGDGTNLARTERQRDFMKQLLSQFASKTDMSTTALIEIADYMLSDLSASSLSNTAEKLAKAEHLGILSPKGEALAGEEFIEFYADDSHIKELVISLFYKVVE